MWLTNMEIDTLARRGHLPPLPRNNALAVHDGAEEMVHCDVSGSVLCAASVRYEEYELVIPQVPTQSVPQYQEGIMYGILQRYSTQRKVKRREEKRRERTRR